MGTKIKSTQIRNVPIF